MTSLSADSPSNSLGEKSGGKQKRVSESVGQTVTFIGSVVAFFCVVALALWP